ncbi:MAG: hypothetical protein ACFCVA_18570, partial [Gammaproteobacteria bacterium]
FRKVKNEHPFEIDAIVVLPEHLHCIWTLPSGDADYPTRWRFFKEIRPEKKKVGSTSGNSSCLSVIVEAWRDSCESSFRVPCTLSRIVAMGR